MSQIEFGIYYVPEENSTFYQRGSEIVGYDIRNERKIDDQVVNKMRIQKKWQEASRQYGLHMTITDIVSIDSGRLQEVVKNVSGLIGNKGYSNIYLKVQTINFVRGNKNVLGAVAEKNEEILNLHSKLLEIQDLGDSSFYTRTASRDSEWVSSLSFEQQKNLKKHMSPYVLGRFFPHFTLLNPAPILDNEVINLFNKTLCLPTVFRLQNLSIVYRNMNEQFLRIYDEIPIKN